MIEFTILYDIKTEDGLNSVLRMNNKYYRSKVGDKWRLLVRESTQKIPFRTFEKPVFIEFVFESSLDADGHSVLIKEIVDSLVFYGWLINDNRKRFSGYSVRFKRDEEFEGKGVKVKVYEVE